MAMTLRLTDDDTEALRDYSAAAGRSMQDVAREAIRSYIEQRAQARDAILARIVHEDAALLDLLAK